MKKILLSICLLFSISIVKAQLAEFDFDIKKVPIVDGKVTYTLIDTVDGLSKDKIQSKLTEWIATNFVSANHVIQLNDKDAGKIIVKGSSTQYAAQRLMGTDRPFPYTQSFTLNFTIKEGKYRVIMSDFGTEVKVITGTYSSKIVESRIEDALTNIPATYDFKQLSRTQKEMLNYSKQYAKNTFTDSETTLKSIKSFVRKNASGDSKKDEF